MVRLIAETQSVASHPRGTKVVVRVVGPKAAPEFTKETRARAQALVSAGPVRATRKSIENITMGEIDRLTEVESTSRRRDPAYLSSILPFEFPLPESAEMEAKTYTIIVKEE